MKDNAVQAAVGRLAAAQKHKHSAEKVAKARDDLLAAKTERCIQEALRPAKPYAPLSLGERTRLAQLLLGDEWKLK